MNSSILFLVFNRPDTTSQVFEAIRAARPPRLYVAADGPRAHVINDEERCARVRKIATQVDWPCEIKTRFRDVNYGCKLGVSRAIDWFFTNEEEGIILEDDVLPLPCFFEYCDLMLERYRNNPEIGIVSGCNLVMANYTSPDSYFFSRYVHIWGWASWRRVWQQYDVQMTDWPAWRDANGLYFALKDRAQETYWVRLFEAVHRGQIDTWDYQLVFACWRQNLLSIIPKYNLTHNLGFGIDATHTTAEPPCYIKKSKPQSLTFPLVHPNSVMRDAEGDEWIATRLCNNTYGGRIRGLLSALRQRLMDSG